MTALRGTMLPDWFTKPESLYRTMLFLTSPLYVWLMGKAVRHMKAWHASRTESVARVRLASLSRALENPPTLLESVGYIVCFLPLPIVVTLILFVLYFAPQPAQPPHPDPRLAHLAQEMVGTFFFLLFFLNYLIFGALAFHGIQVAYRLRHGEARYAENYKAGVQKQIDRLKKKFPRL